MSIISQKFPILKDPASGLLSITIILACLLNIWVFQDMIELPKMLVWFFGLGLTAIILTFAKNRSLQIPKIILWLAIASVIGLMIGSIFSYDPINSIFGFFPRYISSVVYFLSWFGSLILLGYFSKEEKLKLLELVIFLAGLISLLALFQNFGIFYYAGATEDIRNLIPSFLGNPNFCAMFVVVTIPLQLWYLGKSWGQKNFLYYFTIFSVSIVGLVLFNSRGAFVGLLVALLGSIALYLYQKKLMQTFFIALILVVVSVIAVKFYTVSRVDIAGAGAESASVTTERRFLIWDLSITQIQRTPWFGTGLGNFFLAYRFNNNSALASGQWFDDAHNVVLQYFTTSGLIVGGLFLLMIVLSLFYLIRALILEKDYYSGFIALSIVVWFVVGSFTPLVSPIWLQLALLLSMSFLLFSNQKIVDKGLISKISLVIFGLILIFLSTVMLISELFLWRARLASDQSNYLKMESYAKSSLRVYPYNSSASLVLAKSLIEQRSYDELEKLLDHFSSLHPSSSGIYQSLSEYYINMYADTENLTYKTKAIAATELMALYDNNYGPHVQIAAKNMIILKEPKKAEAYARKSVVLDPENYYSWILFAKAEYDLGEKKTTISCLKKAYEIHPTELLGNLIDIMSSTSDVKKVPFPESFD